MQRVQGCQDVAWAMWLTFVALIGFSGWASATAGQEASDIPANLLGVVVEEVGEGSALEKAGLRPGDIVFAWERLPAPPANPQGDQGMIESVFDWMWLRIEQVPRGTLKLTGQRSGEIHVFEILPGEWKVTLRARMSEGMLEDYAKGKALIEAEKFEAGIHLWHEVVGTSEKQEADGRLRCWLQLRIGDAWGKARQWEKAHDAYLSALRAAQDPRSQVAVWGAIGGAYGKASEFEAARGAYGSAQQIRESIWGESLVFARGLHKLGLLDWWQSRLDSVQSHWQRALRIRKKLAPGSLDVAASLNNMGIISWTRGDLDRADEYHQGSLMIRQMLAPGSLDVAISLTNLGNVARKRGSLDQAAEYYKGALEIDHRLTPDSLDVAAGLNNLGNVACDRGDLDRANEYHTRALEIYQTLAPGSLDEAGSLNNLGIVASRRGNLDQATEYHERSLEITQKLAPGSLDVAGSLNNLGALAAGRGDLDRAADYYGRDLEITQKLAPGSVDVATSLNNLGLLAAGRGDLDLADEYFEGALEIQQKLAPDSLDLAASLRNLGNLASERGELDRAVQYFEKSLEITQNLAPVSLDMAEGLNNLGDLALKRGKLDRAAEAYERNLEITQKLAIGSSKDAEALHDLATVRRKQNQRKPALDLFLQALQALESQISRLGGSQDIRASFRAERVAYYRDTISLFLELQQPVEAFHILERSRGRNFLAQLAERDLMFSDVPEELERQRRRITYSYDRTQYEIAQHHSEEQAKEVETLLARLHQLQRDYEDITEKIIEDSPRLGALRYPSPLNFNGARQVLDPGTVMLSFSVGKDETHLFVLTRDDELRVKTVLLGEKEIRGEVKNILRLQERRSSPVLYEKPLRQVGERLYQALILPAEELIAKSDRVLIVPDGPLLLLPFGLLARKIGLEEGHGGRDLEYLAEWKPLHSVLSATVYAELKNQRRSQSDKESDVRSLAAFGDPQYPFDRSRDNLATDRSVDVYVRAAARRGNFPRLPHTRDEVIATLQHGGAARVFLGAEATEEQAKAVGKGVRILHFATHGRYDDSIPLNSYLALTIPKKFREDQENGLLQAWEIFEDVRLEADLVVLSACESGLGEEINGEGLKGLTRAFQFAGARTVISSLWQVDDQITAELMVRFYRHLREGMTKDEALRAAQIEFIREPIEVTDVDGRKTMMDASAPYYWAAFQIFGDWQ